MHLWSEVWGHETSQTISSCNAVFLIHVFKFKFSELLNAFPFLLKHDDCFFLYWYFPFASRHPQWYLTNKPLVIWLSVWIKFSQLASTKLLTLGIAPEPSESYFENSPVIIFFFFFFSQEQTPKEVDKRCWWWSRCIYCSPWNPGPSGVSMRIQWLEDSLCKTWLLSYRHQSAHRRKVTDDAEKDGTHNHLPEEHPNLFDIIV